MKSNRERFEELLTLIYKTINISSYNNKYVQDLIDFSRFLLIDNDQLNKINSFKNIDNNSLIEKIKNENSFLKEQNNNLIAKFSKKLTFKERITGRIDQ